MVAPKRRKHSKRRWRLPMVAAAAAVVGAALWFFGFALWSHAAMDGAAPKSAVVSPHALMQVAEPEDLSILHDLWPDDHEEEEVAESLRSCVDDCLGESPPQPSRVGLLYPPGELGLIFVSFIHLTVSKNAANTKAEIVWEPTSHLLPADKNHRYSHVVRFATLPLILAAGDAMLQFSPPSSISWRDITETVELLLQWHCEISNLVHEGWNYPVMTMTMEQIEEDAMTQSIMLSDFIAGLSPEDDDNEEFDSNFESKLVNQLHAIVDRVKPLLLRLDGEFQQDPNRSLQDKNLEGMVKRIIRDFLSDDVECPKQLAPLKVPTSDAGRALYESLKSLPASLDPREYDLKRCTDDASLSGQPFCRTLPDGFDTKGLVKFLYEHQGDQEEQEDAADGNDDDQGGGNDDEPKDNHEDDVDDAAEAR